MAINSKKREQLNISLANDSPLASKLREAEQITGQPRTQIARAVLDTFLETWLQVEQTRQHLVDAAKAATRAEDAVVVRDLGSLRPPRRFDQYRPEPDYWKTVEARRRVPPNIVERFSDVPVRQADPWRPTVRLVPADQRSLDDEADADA